MKKIISLLLVVLMCLALTACATKPQEKKTYTVGICQLIEHPALDAATQGFKDALVDALGDAVTFDDQNASGDSGTCAIICNGFVSNGVDLILGNATAALQAAVAATDTIPVLGTSITEYGTALGIENFTGTVGGNVSGCSDLAPLDQQAAEMVALFPEAKNVVILYCSSEDNSKYQARVISEELAKLGVKCTEETFVDSNDVALATQKACGDGDAIYIPTDNTCAACAATIDSIARAAGVPIYAGEEGICDGCGVATLSISYYDLGYSTGKMAVKILTGEADISTMPIAYADKFTKEYNKERAELYNITIPEGYVEIGSN